MDLLWGNLHFESESKNEQSGFREAATLQTIVAGQLIAAVVYIREVGERKEAVIYLYVFLSLLPILGMIFMLNARNKAGRHYYDRATVTYVRRSMVVAMLLTAGVGFVAAADKLPFQPRYENIRLDFAGAYPYRWQNADDVFKIRQGDPGIDALYRFYAISEGDLQPSSATIKVHLSKGLAESWQVAEVKGYVGAYSVVPLENEPDENCLLVRDRDQTFVSWTGLDAGGVYTLRIMLHRLADKGLPPASLLDLFQTDHSRAMKLEGRIADKPATR